MSQPEHVQAKNLIHFLIYCLLKSDHKQKLIKEIQLFTFEPPVKENGICGYEYKAAKKSFQLNLTKQSTK